MADTALAISTSAACPSMPLQALFKTRQLTSGESWAFVTHGYLGRHYHHRLWHVRQWLAATLAHHERPQYVIFSVDRTVYDESAAYATGPWRGNTNFRRK
jgi:hypothetical protein